MYLKYHCICIQLLKDHICCLRHVKEKVVGDSQWSLGQYQRSVWIGWNSETMLSLHLAIRSCRAFYPCSSCLSCSLPNRCCQGWRVWMSNPFSLPWQRSSSVCFPRSLLCTWGIFSFLLWEVASSFPKYILHLLFKQKSFGVWRVGVGIVKSFVWCELECWLSVDRSP